MPKYLTLLIMGIILLINNCEGMILDHKVKVMCEDLFLFSIG